MKNVPSLSDIYSKNVLAPKEEVAPKATTETEFISEAKKTKTSNVVTKKMDIGNGKDKKLVGDGPNKVKLPQKASTGKKAKFTTMESHNTFEKLFRSTISENTENEMQSQSLGFEVPVTPEELSDEIEGAEDEVTDLVTDLKDVVSKLNDILSKIETETSETDTEEDDMGNEAKDEFERENSEDNNADENNVKESVETSGQSLASKKSYTVKGNPKVHGGKAHTGKVCEDPEPKNLKAGDAELRNVKNQKVKTSNIKVGDLFK
jgi:hypothetical protein